MTTTTPLTPTELTEWQGKVDNLSSFEQEVLDNWKAGNATFNALTTTVGADISKLSLASDAIGEKIQPL
jgi:hypothetical protein